MKSLEFIYNQMFNAACHRRLRKSWMATQHCTASHLLYNTINNWQVGAGVMLLFCAPEIFIGKAGVPRKQRVCRCNVLPLFYCVLTYYKHPVVFHC